LRTRDLVDTFLIYKEETVRGTDLKFAAALVVFEVCSVFFVMVTTIKVSTERRKSGIGSAFFRDVAQYISDETSERLYTSSYMVVHQYRGLNPHGFYKKLGFVDYPV
jgi:GNAT superfamily N-acetyltransferase